MHEHNHEPVAISRGHNHNHAVHHHAVSHKRTDAHNHNHTAVAGGTAHQGAEGATDRRQFFSSVASWAGLALLEASVLSAARARAQSAQFSGREQLFDLERVANGIYAALARPQAEINSNAAIFVGPRDVLIVDAHSKPSAAAALIAQLRREVTPLPVRYLVNSHFHWDHMQGNSAYRAAFPQLQFVASSATHDLMAKNSEARLKASLEESAKLLEQHRAALAAAHEAAERAFHQGQIDQITAYQREMAHFTLELPQVVLAEGLDLGEGEHRLELRFMGLAHTGGDVIVFSPSKKVIATGDMLHGFLPFIADGYPKLWPATLGKVGKLPFNRVLPGHGPVHRDRIRLIHKAGYISELTERVERGKQQGRSVAELQQSITPASLPSLNSDRYGDLVRDAYKHFEPWYGTPPSLDDAVKVNVQEVWNRLEAK